MLFQTYRLLILTGALLSVGQTGVADDKSTAIAGGESRICRTSGPGPQPTRMIASSRKCWEWQLVPVFRWQRCRLSMQFRY